MSNQMMDLILSRRSIRKFDSERHIPESILSDLLRAAASAPSGMGRHTWKFTAVVNSAMIKRLASAIGNTLNRTNYNFYQPAALIIPSNDRDSIWGKEDNACALENIFLAAHSYGLGSVWINQLQGICDTPTIREILTDLHIPDKHVVYGMAAIGYPDEDTPAPSVDKPLPFEIIQ